MKIEVVSNFAAERERYDQMVSEFNLDDLVNRYPLKKSPAFKRITNELHFKSRELYESRVVTLVRSDPLLAKALKSRIKPLADAIDEEQINDGNDTRSF